VYSSRVGSLGISTERFDTRELAFPHGGLSDDLLVVDDGFGFRRGDYWGRRWRRRRRG
jgi:hypothetical protein